MCFYFRSESSRDGYLKDLARDNTQLLLNKIWELPTERVEGVIVAKLPAPTVVLPREKPLPKPKPLTKWQKYAQEKGITKIKKSKLKWDETLQVN
jgi:regulator of ribosome biosynthesis